jgi:hypothetical protein
MVQSIEGVGTTVATELLTKNPNLFSMQPYTLDLNIKRMKDSSKKLLMEIIK